MNPPKELEAIRAELEALDRSLLGLLKQRMGLMEAVADSKLRSAAPFRDPLREEEVLRRVARDAESLGLDPSGVERIFRDVMEMAIARQAAHAAERAERPLRVIYPGVEGSESHVAARQRYAGTAEGVLLIPAAGLRDAVEAVRTGRADRALLSIESTRSGSLDETYDAIAQAGLSITAEVIAELDHHLLGVPGAQLAKVRRVLADGEALEHCAAFLGSHPALEIEPIPEAVEGARRVLQARDPGLAVIAGGAAARLFGLSVIAPDVDGKPSHAARFVEVSPSPVSVPGGVRCKTSLWLELEHRPGALGEVLSRLARHGVNLTKIESRPIPGQAWRYRFFVDVECPGGSEVLSTALEDIRPLASTLKSLGTYPTSERA